MERRGHFQRRNPCRSSSSSSTSYSQSARSRLNRFPKSAPNSSGRGISGHREPEVAAENETPDPPAIAGTCHFMCPEEERAQREGIGDLAVFERLNINSSLSSPSLAVKKFGRTITTRQVRIRCSASPCIRRHFNLPIKVVEVYKTPL